MRAIALCAVLVLGCKVEEEPEGLPVDAACAEQQVALCDKLAALSTEEKPCGMACAGYATACRMAHDVILEEAQVACLAAISAMDSCDNVFVVPPECLQASCEY
jgi:hypothetical protein